MRIRPILLAAVASLAATHVLGVLLGAPIVRYAEVLALLLLLAYALAAGLPSPRWALPAALGVLVVDAVRTLPDPPSDYGWYVLRPGPIDRALGFEVGLSLTWAPLVAVLVLLVLGRGGSGPFRIATVAAAVAAVLVVAYAIVRVVDTTRSADEDVGGAVGTAVLAPVTLALAAMALAALLARRGLRLAAAGAALLAAAALPHLDAAIDAVPLPRRFGGDHTAVFSWFVIPPSLELPAPMPALTAAVELTAYALLVVGLCGARSAAELTSR